jgi:hypothetical protein
MNCSCEQKFHGAKIAKPTQPCREICHKSRVINVTPGL